MVAVGAIFSRQRLFGAPDLTSRFVGIFINEGDSVDEYNKNCSQRLKKPKKNDVAFALSAG